MTCDEACRIVDKIQNNMPLGGNNNHFYKAKEVFGTAMGFSETWGLHRCDEMARGAIERGLRTPAQVVALAMLAFTE